MGQLASPSLPAACLALLAPWLSTARLSAARWPQDPARTPPPATTPGRTAGNDDTPPLAASAPSVIGWHWPAALRQTSRHHPAKTAQTAQAAFHRASDAMSGPAVPTPSAEPARPTATATLRVCRLLESGQGPEQAGRMVISGRLADVCAELDRLSAARR